MRLKKHLFFIILIAAVVTILLQLNLTQAIFFNSYLESSDIVLGRQDKAYYLALVNESAKGNWQLGSPYLKEWSHEPYLYPALNIHIAGVFMRTLGLDIKTMLIVMDYGAVFILMALAYALFLVMFRGNSWGYVVGTWYVFFPRMLIWNRTISPQINFIFLFLFLIAYFVSPRDRFSWKHELALGTTAGLLFYTYPYHWTFALPLLVFTDIWIFFQQRKIILSYFYKYVVIAVLGAFYFMHLWRIYHIAYYEESARRIGALYSRLPAGILTQAIVIFCLGIFAVLYYTVFSKKKIYISDVSFGKLCIGLLVSLIVLNQQIITGMQLEFNSHYITVILVFLIGFAGALAYSVMTYVLRAQRIVSAFGIVVMIFLVRNAFILETASNPFFKLEHYATSDEIEIFNWFNGKKIRDHIVYAPAKLGDKLVLLTGNYLYFHEAQELHIMPTSELVDRFTYFDVTNQDITQNLKDYQLALFGRYYDSALHKDNTMKKVRSIVLRKPFVPGTLDEYLTFDFSPMREKRINVTPQLFDEHLAKYHVDYVVYRASDRNSIYRDIPGAIVFENDVYVIKSRRDL